MGRTEIRQGPIEIAYGLDHASGYFLSVCDSRLYDYGDVSDEVNSVALNVTKGAGYFDLHTGTLGGFGQRVSLDTLLFFWGRYGVPEEDIQRARSGKEVAFVPGTNGNAIDTPSASCIICGKLTALRCSKCKSVYACSKEHSKQGWKKHKSQCTISTADTNRMPEPYIQSETAASTPADNTPEPQYPIKRVKAYLLPVDAASPRLVTIECEVRPPEDGERGFDSSRNGARALLNTDGGIEVQLITTSAAPWMWGCTGSVVEIAYRAMFMSDGSQLNQCVQTITSGKAKHPWSGHMLVLKQRDSGGHQISERYVDVDEQALHAAKRYLTSYGADEID